MEGKVLKGCQERIEQIIQSITNHTVLTNQQEIHNHTAYSTIQYLNQPLTP